MHRVGGVQGVAWVNWVHGVTRAGHIFRLVSWTDLDRWLHGGLASLLGVSNGLNHEVSHQRSSDLHDLGLKLANIEVSMICTKQHGQTSALQESGGIKLQVTDDDMQPEEKSVIKVKVLFFASAREAAGDVTSVELELKEGMKTSDLRKRLASLYPKLSSMALDEDNLTLALNEEYVTSGQNPPLNNGDTIALIPPISGG